MNNLGGYQLLTTLAKRVGGPKNLVLLGMVGGYAVFRTFESGTKKAIKVIKVQLNKNRNISNHKTETFNITSDGTYDDDLSFEIGEQYHVLESDGDAILIEKIGDQNNPYFVPASLLKSISDFNAKE